MGQNDNLGGGSRPLNPHAKGDKLSHDRFNESDRRAVHEVVVRGRGVRSTRVGNTVTILIQDPPSHSRDWFPAKITGNAAMSGEDNRYQYAWTEQQRTATGWEDLADGRTGTTSAGFALNMREAFNAATGIQGNSIDHDAADYPAGFELQPVQGNPVVRMTATTDNAGNLAYDFEYENAEDGPCEEEEE